jgi:hypothetical protein
MYDPIPRPTFEVKTVGDYQREAQLKGSLDRATGSGAYGSPGDGTGPHFHMGHVLFGFFLAGVTWLVGPLIGIHEFFAFPALLLGIVFAGVLTKRRSRSARKPRSVRFYILAGAFVFTGLGLWFAISEGDISLTRAAITSAPIGAVLGLVWGVVVKMLRALFGRRAAA